jgi:hypothetical protein
MDLWRSLKARAAFAAMQTIDRDKLVTNAVQFESSRAELYGIFRRFLDISHARLAVIPQ